MKISWFGNYNVLKKLINTFLWAVLTSLTWGYDFSPSGQKRSGWGEVSVKPPNNSTFQALIYYPAQTATQDAEVDSNAGPCPGVSFGHGFLVNPDNYRSIFVHLASWGYVVIAPRSGGEFPKRGSIFSRVEPPFSPHPYNRLQGLLLVEFGVDLGNRRGAVAEDDVGCFQPKLLTQNVAELVPCMTIKIYNSPGGEEKRS